MRKHKIAVVVNDDNVDFNSEFSAVASYLKFVSECFDSEKYDIVLTNGSSNSSTRVKPNQSQNKLKKVLKNVVKKVLPKTFLKKKENLQREKVDRISNLFCNNNFDVIIEFLDYGSTLSSLHKSKQNSKSIIIYDAPLVEKYETFHTYTYDHLNWIKYGEKQSVENADYIVCYSNSVKSFLDKNFNITSELSVFPCISGKNYTTNRNEELGLLRIGFIGSFLKWHKVDLLVEVFDELRKKYSNIKLDLVGKGLEWESVKELVDVKQINHLVDLHGFVSEKELQNIKSRLDIGVMPGSNWYGSPLKIFEYAQIPIPVVAASEPTILDLFESNKEILFIDKKEEFNSLYNHLEQLIKSSDLRNQLSDAIRQKNEKSYSKNAYISFINNVVEKVINK